MKPYFPFVLLIVITFLSCDHEKEEAGLTVTADSATQEITDDDSRFESVDSTVFHIGNHEFTISPSTKSDFDAVKPSIHKMDTSEAKRMKPFNAFVSRHGDSLLFKKSDNEYAYLVNNDNTDSDDYASFDFIEEMPEI